MLEDPPATAAPLTHVMDANGATVQLCANCVARVAEGAKRSLMLGLVFLTLLTAALTVCLLASVGGSDPADPTKDAWDQANAAVQSLAPGVRASAWGILAVIASLAVAVSVSLQQTVISLDALEDRIANTALSARDLVAAGTLELVALLEMCFLIVMASGAGGVGAVAVIGLEDRERLLVAGASVLLGLWCLLCLVRVQGVQRRAGVLATLTADARRMRISDRRERVFGFSWRRLYATVAAWWIMAAVIAVGHRAAALGWNSAADPQFLLAAIFWLLLLRLLSLSGRTALAEVGISRAVSIGMAVLVQAVAAAALAIVVVIPAEIGANSSDGISLRLFISALMSCLLLAWVATTGEAGSRPLAALAARSVLRPNDLGVGPDSPGSELPRGIKLAIWGWVLVWPLSVPATAGLITGAWAPVLAAQALVLLALLLAAGLAAVAARSPSPLGRWIALTLGSFGTAMAAVRATMLLPATPWVARVTHVSAVLLLSVLVLLPLSGCTPRGTGDLAAALLGWRRWLQKRRSSAVERRRRELCAQGPSGAQLAGCDIVGCGDVVGAPLGR